MLNKLINEAKIKFYKELIEKNRTSNKNLWQAIKYMTGINNKNTNIINDILKVDGQIVRDPIKIANVFNKHFVEVGQKLADDLPDLTLSEPEEPSNRHSMFLTPVCDEEVIGVIDDLKPNSSPGLDGMTAMILKQTKLNIASHICFMINKIMETGFCPEEFKISMIIPVHKQGDKKSVSNYRPIALTSTLTKIFEKTIKKRLLSFLIKHNIICSGQFGFQEKKSTEDAISALTSAIYTNLDNKKPGLCVFLDLKKAFDTISHEQMLNSLNRIGIRGKVYKLFESYLTCRKQCVKCCGLISDVRTTSWGIPQGTVLGPILFLIYINGLLKIEGSHKLIGFADDIAVYYEGKNWVEVKTRAEEGMTKIIRWLHEKKLTLNIDKTVYMPFSSYINTLPDYNDLTITTSGKIYNIKRAQKVKYLGLTIDCHMRWTYHIDCIVNTLRTLLPKFRQLRMILDIADLRKIYQALVESRLRYGLLSWGGVSATHVRKLETTQRRFLKIMFKRENKYPSDQLYAESRVHDIRQLFFLLLTVHTHKNKKFITYKSGPHYTRSVSRNEIEEPYSPKSIGQRCHTFLAPRCYNKLPSTVRSCNTMRQFKKQVNTYILATNRSQIRKFITLQL